MNSYSYCIPNTTTNSEKIYSGRQSDAGRAATAHRGAQWQSVLSSIAERRIRNRVSAFASIRSIIFAATQFHHARANHRNGLVRSNKFSPASFELNLNAFSDFCFLSNYCFRKEDFCRLVTTAAWLVQKQLTDRNRYKLTPSPSRCVLLKYLPVQARLRDL